MSVQALMNLHQGNLTEALNDLQTQIKKDPSNAKLRVFLFQLLLISGQWERALVQLRVVGELDASTLLMVQTYRAAIECVALRAKVFSGEHSPLIFGQPQQWIALLVEGLRLDAIGQSHESARLRNQAFELAPTNSKA